MLSPKAFIEEVERRLEQGSAPILYLHKTGTEGSFAVIIKSEYLDKLMDAWAALQVAINFGMNSDKEKQHSQDLWMHHSHLEGDEEDYPHHPDLLRDRNLNAVLSILAGRATNVVDLESWDLKAALVEVLKWEGVQI